MALFVQYWEEVSVTFTVPFHCIRRNGGASIMHRIKKSIHSFDDLTINYYAHIYIGAEWWLIPGRRGVTPRTVAPPTPSPRVLWRQSSLSSNLDAGCTPLGSDEEMLLERCGSKTGRRRRMF